MTNRASSLVEKFLCWWAIQILRYPLLLLVLFVALCGLSLQYTINNLGVNTDTSELLSPDLPFQQNRSRWEKEFPQDSTTILFVVDAETAEHTSLAANELAKRLQQNSEFFDAIYIPGDNQFFRQQGFLYLDQNELEDLAVTLTDAQPFIGYLAENYSLEGLLDILGKALDNTDNDLPMELDPLLEEIDLALVSVKNQKDHYLSWQKLLSVNPSDDRNTLRSIVSAKPKLDFQELLPAEHAINRAHEISREIQAQVPGVTIRLTGEKALEQEEMKSVSEDTATAGVVSLILVCLTLSLGLRSIKLVISTFIALIMGLILTAGYAALTVGHLNVLSVAFAVIFIGLGVDFAIHICLRYRECREQQMTNTDAIKDSVKTIGGSLILCALTTSIGFFAFVPTDYAGVSELGFISGGGMFIGLFISLTVLPALLKLFPVKDTGNVRTAWLPEFMYTFPFRYATSIRVISVLLAIAATFCLTQLSFDSNPVNLRDPNSESVLTFMDLLKSPTDSPFALIALRNDRDSAEQLAKTLTNLPTVKRVITLSSLIAENQAQKLETIDDLNLVLGAELNQFNRPLEHTDTRQALLDLDLKINQALDASSTKASVELLQKLQRDIQEFVSFADNSELPTSSYRKLDTSILGLLPYTMEQLNLSLTAYPFGLKDIPPYITKNWLSASGIYKIMIEPVKDLTFAENLKEFANEVQVEDDTVTGLPVADLASGQAVVNAFIQAFTGALAIIFLILLLILRSFRNTFLVIWPLLLAGLLTAAINVLLDNPFNFANIIVMPLLMGMGVDSGIHIIHRLQSGLKQDEHLLQTSTAKGVFFSSMTTLCSFASLAFTAHRGIASMGLLLSVGITLTLICTLIVLPAFSKKKLTFKPVTSRGI